MSATSLKAAIIRLRDLAEANAGRSSQEALAANLMSLRDHGVGDDVLDLAVEMVFAHNLDEEMTAAVNYLASGFLLALMTFEDQGARRVPSSLPKFTLSGPVRGE